MTTTPAPSHTFGPTQGRRVINTRWDATDRPTGWPSATLPVEHCNSLLIQVAHSKLYREYTVHFQPVCFVADGTGRANPFNGITTMRIESDRYSKKDLRELAADTLGAMPDCIPAPFEPLWASILTSHQRKAA